MDVRAEAAEFLRTRRDRLTPERAGLPAWGEHRRVTGLRREEVAMLAGVSVDYYTRLERGNLRGASEQVLGALADALQLDDAERSHLADLARAASGGPSPRLARATVRPPVRWLLDAMGDTAAYVRNVRTDVLATNALGAALYAPVLEGAHRPNIARFIFLDPAAHDFFADWERVARESSALLRTLAGENRHDAALMQLVGELCTRSPEFRALWARHDVRQHRTGTKSFRHPLVGEMTLAYESMQLTADPGVRLNAYVAEPGTESAQRFALLASWANAPSATAAVPATEG